VWPRFLVCEDLEELLGSDGEVDGADEPKRGVVDEAQVDPFARISPSTNHSHE
jgi:hypothetical protein